MSNHREIKQIPTNVELDKLEISSTNVRKIVNETEIESLAKSIKHCGLLQLPVVRRKENGKFEVIIGQKRVLAAKRAGLTSIPCFVEEVSDSEAIAISLIENIERGDLNPIDRARACKKLVDTYGSLDAVAKKLSKDKSTISSWISILKLEPEVQEKVAVRQRSKRNDERPSGISYTQARELVRKFGSNPEKQKEVAKAIEGLSDKETHRVLDILDANPDLPAREAARLIFSPQETKEIQLTLPSWLPEKLKEVAQDKMLELDSLIENILTEWLHEKGYLQEAEN